MAYLAIYPLNYESGNLSRKKWSARGWQAVFTNQSCTPPPEGRVYCEKMGCEDMEGVAQSPTILAPHLLPLYPTLSHCQVQNAIFSIGISSKCQGNASNTCVRVSGRSQEYSLDTPDPQIQDRFSTILLTPLAQLTYDQHD